MSDLTKEVIVKINYDQVETRELFSGNFSIYPGKVRGGMKEFSFTNKSTGGKTTRWIPLERLGKDEKAEELAKARKKRQLDNRATRAEENRARAKQIKKK